jgi:protoporphyrinogen oxidase
LYDKSISGGIEMRVGIIGGGPGGLLTAYLLDRKSPTELRTKIFEASNRVGGKLLTSHFECGSVPYEAGAAEVYGYSHVGPDPLYNLVKSFGLSTRDMVGRAVVLDGQILGSPKDIKRHFGNKTWSAIKKFHKRGRKLISPLAYYESGYDDDNLPWARRSFQSILDKVPGRHARRYLKVAVHSDLATAPLEGGMESLIQALVANTTAQIALNSAVTRVKRNRFSTYNIYYRNRGSVLSEEFDAVVVALPNCCIPGVEWETKQLGGAMCKHHLRYEGIAHYLRLSLLFQKPFWRDAISGSYFQSDSFGGCCIYDESSKLDTGNYGVLSWLVAGSEALLKSNLDDRILIEQALDSLPNVLSVGRDLFLEGKVNRWVGTVSAPRLGQHIRGAKIRHLPDPKGHPGLFVVGDYLFDTTVNGILDSADIATNLVLRHIGVKRRSFSLESPRINLERSKNPTLSKSYFRFYDGKNDYKDALKAYFGHKHIMRQIKIIWGMKPPYRLLDSGSACGLSLDAFARANVDAWGIENNDYIYEKMPARLKKKNILGDVRDLPFEDNYFDFVYDTCLCYLPGGDIDQAYGNYIEWRDTELCTAVRSRMWNGLAPKRTRCSMA